MRQAFEREEKREIWPQKHTGYYPTREYSCACISSLLRTCGKSLGEE